MRRTLGLLLALALIGSVQSAQAEPRRTAKPAAAPTATPAATIVAVGDIACAPGSKVTATKCQQAATAAISRKLRPTRVLALGDLQYPDGTYRQFLGSYAKSWGKQRSITYPVAGNHEYHTRGAAGYYRYFKYRQPGAPGYYRRSLNGWQLYFLNTNCTKVDCARQRAWLERELSAHPSRCALIAGHHPRFSSGGEHGSSAFMRSFWAIAYRHQVDVALSGHDHDYERFAPMDPAGRASAAGIRQFVSGAGGKNHYRKGTTVPGSQRFISKPFGVLRMTLRPTSYSWQFVDTAGKVRDSGTTACH
ncbi:alkaline phosphatase [Nocardioides marmoriginsengisoli]|uniref:Alkaline phosphatase n=1 Tax=Nocardioides marmoriginsengisoli TaxID=661483 RepID=A0A3N0CBU3_9ACTN|nr:metallophosphoesterase [Nocardioides marmoriginsengisoli]RNL60536.1 alkaline phosphatase [Nocardioides marmoriginsengisoli]